MSAIDHAPDRVSLQLYIELMTGIKLRLGAGQKSPDSQSGFRKEIFGVEFIMLQVRMVCELIGLACLAAHYEVPVTRTGKFLREHSADLIFRKLSDYHSDFYPQPIVLRVMRRT